LSLALAAGIKLGMIDMASAKKRLILAKANTILIFITPAKAGGK
jgi:hypothetical protein